MTRMRIQAHGDRTVTLSYDGSHGRRRVRVFKFAPTGGHVIERDGLVWKAVYTVDGPLLEAKGMILANAIRRAYNDKTIHL